MNTPKHIDVDEMRNEFFYEKDIESQFALLVNVILLRILLKVKKKIGELD